MADAFDTILGQPKVRDLLRASVQNERTTHAYLFTGPAGSNKTQSAFALAQALLCLKGAHGPRGGVCGACESCTRIRRKTHPDVHFFEPAGVNGYLIEQIRDIVSDVSLAPIQGNLKVYILDRVDLLGTSAANAFLKTLEEPPENVVLILLGRTRESVLPTIVSRCQIIPFRHIPPSEAAGIVSQNTGADIERSQQAIEACSGSISKAVQFLKSSGNAHLQFRSTILRILGRIDALDDWQVVCAAREILEKSKAPLDDVRIRLEEDLAKNADFLAKSAIRQVEAQNKRTLSAQAQEYLKEAFAIIASWLRDIACVCAGTSELIINTDHTAEIEALAYMTTYPRAMAAVVAIQKTKKMLDYNVSPETCLDRVLFDVREVFKGEGRTNQLTV